MTNLRVWITGMSRIAGAVLVSWCVEGAVAAEKAGGKATSPIEVGEEIVVTASSPERQDIRNSSVAGGRGCYLIVWREGWVGKGGNSRVFAARVSADGKLLDSRPVALAGGAAGLQDRPRAAFCGDCFLVVWQDFGNGKDMDVLGARIGLDGKLLDARPLTIAAGPRTQVLPEIASDGKTGWLVVWQGFQGEEVQCRAFAAHIQTDGTIGRAMALDIGPAPRVAWNGKVYLEANGPLGVFNTMCVRTFSADGKPAGPGVVNANMGVFARWSLSAMPGRGWVIVSHRAEPDLWGWGGPGAFIAFGLKEDGSDDKTQRREQPYPKATAQPSWLDFSGKDHWPWGYSAVAWDGGQCIAVWPRQHFTGHKNGGLQELANADLMAGRITRPDWGTPDQLAPVPVAATPADEQNPSLAADGNGSLLCVYEKNSGSNTFVCARRLESVLTSGQAIKTTQDKPVEVVLTSVAGDAAFSIEAQPVHGTLGGTPPRLTYTPAKNYSGNDSFVFTAGNGRRKDAATVSIFVRSAAADRELRESGLTGWWSLDEKDGDLAHDPVDGNNGVLRNSPAWQTGRIGGGLKFDGIDDEVAISPKPYESITGNFTIALWAWPEAARKTTGEIASGVVEGIGNGQRVALVPTWAASKTQAGAGLSIGTNGVTVLELADVFYPSVLVHETQISGWVHVALVYENGVPSLFLNGSKVKSGLKSGRTVFPGCALGGSKGSYYQGMLDDVRIYSKALSTEEIARLAGR